MSKVSLLGFSLEELQNRLVSMGIKKYVGKQLTDWIYKKDVTSFEDMLNISKDTKAILEKHFYIESLDLQQSMESEEHAVKMVSLLQDKSPIECVVLKQEGYFTLCVSSQCGCPVDCKFCLTGVAGFKRNLTVDEIVGQVVLAHKQGYPIKNLVFMGMGEPLLNFDVLFAAIDILQAPWGFDIAKRKVTISTSGFIKTIQQLIDNERYVNLAFSVGCTNPIKRETFMPVEKANPITKVAPLIHAYQKLHNRQLTLEYTLLNGVNDTDQDIEGLINLAKYLNAKINLINLNPHPKIPFKPIAISKLKSIQRKVMDAKVYVTIRYRKGQDIAAACGQLGDSLIKSRS